MWGIWIKLPNVTKCWFVLTRQKSWQTTEIDCFLRKNKIKGHRLEEVENYKYLESVIYNEVSKSGLPRQQQLYLGWKSYGVTRTSCQTDAAAHLIYLSLCLLRAGPLQRNLMILSLGRRCCRRRLNISTKTMWRPGKFAWGLRMQIP